MQGDLGGGHAVDVGADGVEDRAQCVVHEVEHEDQADGAQPAGVLEDAGVMNGLEALLM